MVCHESYKDQSGNWLYPEEVEKIDSKTAIKKKDRSKVEIGPPESMSKSKNTIDPETMIAQYGADELDGLFYQIVHLKRTSNGLIRAFHLLINSYKKFGT